MCNNLQDEVIFSYRRPSPASMSRSDIHPNWMPHIDFVFSKWLTHTMFSPRDTFHSKFKPYGSVFCILLISDNTITNYFHTCHCRSTAGTSCVKCHRENFFVNQRRANDICGIGVVRHCQWNGLRKTRDLSLSRLWTLVASRRVIDSQTEIQGDVAHQDNGWINGNIVWVKAEMYWGMIHRADCYYRDSIVGLGNGVSSVTYLEKNYHLQMTIFWVK